MTNGAKGFFCAVSLHAAAFAALVFGSTTAKTDVVAGTDPLLVMLADPDADPTKSAGLVGRERGLAEGVPDGDNPFESIDLSAIEEQLDRVDEILSRPVPEPAQAEPTPTPEPEPAKTVPAKSAPAAPKKPSVAKKTSPAKPSANKRISFDEWKKNTAGKNKQTTGRGNNSGKAGTTVKKIDVGKLVGNGGGNGKRFGVAGGVGENGGDGGRAVADAQAIYGAEVKQKLAKHLENVLTQSPLSVEATIAVTVRLSVDERGNVKFLEILGNDNPQVRDRVRKAVERIGKCRTPPEGRAFEMRIPDVLLRPR